MAAGSDIRHQYPLNRAACLRITFSQSGSYNIGVPAIGVVYNRTAVFIS